jgi:uncharacterized protein
VKTFVVPLADLERGPKHAVWVLDEKWLNAALEGADAQARGVGRVEVTLSKDGRQVLVKGTIDAALTMPCARTLEPVDVDVTSDMLLMLSPGPAPIPAAKKSRKSGGTAKVQDVANGKGEAKATGRLAKERYLSEEEAAQDHYSGDEIVLDTFIREFILLELPMVPLRSDLRGKDNPAIPGPPEEAQEGPGKQIDPRLAPLAEIAGRLKNDTKE